MIIAAIGVVVLLAGAYGGSYMFTGLGVALILFGLLIDLTGPGRGR